MIYLEALELESLDVKRKLARQIESGVGAAHRRLANVEEVLVLINNYPLKNAGWRGSLQSDKPEIVAAVAELDR